METFPRHSSVRRPISLPRERTLFFPPPSCPDPVLDLLVLATLSTLVSLSTLSLSDSEEWLCVSLTLQQRQIREGWPIPVNRRDTRNRITWICVSSTGTVGSSLEFFLLEAERSFVRPRTKGDFRRSLSQGFLGNICKFRFPRSVGDFAPNLRFISRLAANGATTWDFTKKEASSS